MNRHISCHVKLRHHLRGTRNRFHHLPLPTWHLLRTTSVDPRTQTETLVCSIGTLSAAVTAAADFRGALSKTDGPTPLAFSTSVVEVTSALLCAGLLSNADCSDCCARSADWWLLSARETLGGLSNVTRSLGVSTCPPYDTAVTKKPGQKSQWSSPGKTWTGLNASLAFYPKWNACVPCVPIRRRALPSCAGFLAISFCKMEIALWKVSMASMKSASEMLKSCVSFVLTALAAVKSESNDAI